MSETVELAHTVHHSPAAGVAVLLHSLALDGGVWDPILAPLSNMRTLIVPDLRAHGKSADATGFSIEDMADDVAGLLDRLHVRRAAVIGMSMGGTVAQALAIRHPDRVEALGLVDTTAWYGPTAPADWAQRAGKARTDGLRALSEFQLERWFSDAFRKANPEACQRLLDTFASNDLESYAASCTALGAADVRAGLDDVRVPSSIIVGERDEATPPSHAEEMHHRLRGSELSVIPEGKHLTAYERPTEVAAILARLLT